MTDEQLVFSGDERCDELFGVLRVADPATHLLGSESLGDLVTVVLCADVFR